jgi:adenine-specific DNA-methyltransferase
VIGPLASEPELIDLCVALGAANAGGPLSAAEKKLVSSTRAEATIAPALVKEISDSLKSGGDPLGELFYQLRDSTARRAAGAVYTPALMSAPMVEWLLSKEPQRVVDAGSGSGRFTGDLLRQNSSLHVVAIDLDPVATMMTRATSAVLGGRNVRVLQDDYTTVTLDQFAGRTGFIGNPPYLRHHEIPAVSKAWARSAAARAGLSISGLAGLHAYFYLATAHMAKPGDVGCFVTSAEWLDVNYGAIIRNLLTGSLGATDVHVIEPEAMPFDGTATTAAVVQFQVKATAPTVGFRSVPTLKDLSPLVSTAPVPRQRLTDSSRWSVFLKPQVMVPEGHIELGDIARVHRGAVTGANATWVVKGETDLPEEVLYPSITKARELFAAGPVLATTEQLKRVVDIPTELDSFSDQDRHRIDAFLEIALANDVASGYVARNRKRWWTVGLKAPAPILATYMARRPPAFVVNQASARHINIAHGIYPRDTMSSDEIRVLAACLSSSVILGQGRTYAGGLTKFEPKEMERLTIPNLATLMDYDAATTTAMV